MAVPYCNAQNLQPQKIELFVSSRRAVPAGQIESPIFRHWTPGLFSAGLYGSTCMRRSPSRTLLETIFLFPHPQMAIAYCGA